MHANEVECTISRFHEGTPMSLAAMYIHAFVAQTLAQLPWMRFIAHQGAPGHRLDAFTQAYTRSVTAVFSVLTWLSGKIRRRLHSCIFEAYNSDISILADCETDEEEKWRLIMRYLYSIPPEK